MSRLTRSQNYLMKCLGFVLLFGVISLGAIGGCSDNNGGGQGSTVATTALTENDFGMDPGLIADPEKHLIVKFLEHPDTEETENDTGEVGNDVFPLTYKRTLEHTYCWEDVDPEAGHFMELDDIEGNEILRIDVNGECVTEVIEAGEYVMTIHHDGRILTTHPIFMIPNPDDIQQTRKTDGLINRFKVVIANILQGMQNTVSKDARAQSVSDNISTLISTNRCIRCNLFKADLSNRNLNQVELLESSLRFANLSGSELNSAALDNTDLYGANLSGADLRSAILVFANLSEATLNDANLGGAKLLASYLYEANLSGADLGGADLRRAYLLGADLSVADLSVANLSFATWCDGCQCTDPSIGTCNGCPSVEEACTGS